MQSICEDLDISTKSNRVDIGVRVELPAVIFSHLTDELYESKIVYRTKKFEDRCLLYTSHHSTFRHAWTDAAKGYDTKYNPKEIGK